MENISSHRACVTQEALDRIGFCLLLLINHVADQHFERLHCHIDACVEKHKSHQSENHRTAYCQTKRSCVWKQAHDEYCRGSANKQIRDSTSEPTPSLVAQ